MANALRGMPIAAEMDIFEREVGSDDQLFSAPRPYDSTIVADAEMQNPACRPASSCPARLRMAAISSRSPAVFGRIILRFGLSHGASIPCWSAE